jgi:hypothetical protein
MPLESDAASGMKPTRLLAVRGWCGAVGRVAKLVEICVAASPTG